VQNFQIHISDRYLLLAKSGKAMEGPTPPVPKIVDLHGQLRDPYSGNALEEGQEGPGSIFHAPSSRSDPDYRLFTGEDITIPFSQLMEQLRAAGFEGENIFMITTPRPQDIDRVPSPPPPQLDHVNGSGVETSFGYFYRTKCNYCWAIVQGRERERGFTLREINQAAENGCSTCAVLYAGITRFADLIFPKYESGGVRVRQKENGRSRLLSETRAVNVCFDEYGGETIVLSFNGSSKPENSIANLGHPK
jgi:hypothetical protein